LQNETVEKWQDLCVQATGPLGLMVVFRNIVKPFWKQPSWGKKYPLRRTHLRIVALHRLRKKNQRRAQLMIRAA
jgi:hypothetical protein